jgi:GNAT superfamily N-acetyltransferase
MLYLHMGTALHSESLEPMEVYRTLYDNELSLLWTRPKEMFHEEVSPGAPRFKRVGSLRVASLEDHAHILGFGFDAWGEGRSLEDFIESYKTDRNHNRGTRYLLELADGELVANVNTLRFGRELIGLASLSVDPTYRRRGYASLLLKAVMELFRQENPLTRFLLFSEVSPEVYAKLGFSQLPSSLQFHLPSVAMITGDAGLTDREISCFREYF